MRTFQGSGNPALADKPPTRAEVLRKALEDDIFEGRLKPGERLDEVSLAARFQVSRTPVREALHQLSASGLVAIRPRQGAVVAEVTLRQLLELFDVLAELEGMCARLSARRMSVPERDALQAACEACSESLRAEADLDTYYDANWRFHALIHAGSHNSVLTETTSALRLRASPYLRHQLTRPGRKSGAMREHATVLQAILDGDADRADTAMRAHASIQGDLFGDMLSTLPRDVMS